MRMFDVYVRNGHVECTPPVLHVSPCTYEEIAVAIREPFDEDYRLADIDVTAHKDRLRAQRLSASTIVLRDDNRDFEGDQMKFDIALEPRRKDVPAVDSLDPIIVND